MSVDDIATASVIRYPNLRIREAARGERSGRKDRPVAVGVGLRGQNGDMLVLFPITTRQPQAQRFTQETEKRSAGLDPALRLWIIFDEYITDLVGRSFHLEPEPPLGRFSKAFFLPLLQAFSAGRTEARRVDRSR